MLIALRSTSAGVVATGLSGEGETGDTVLIVEAELPAWVEAREPQRPRWAWNDTSHSYPPLLAAGVRIERCVDLRMCHTILI
ncbi:MAG: hypothetical protein ABI435_09415 [Pseudolysinimonas sp.]